MAWTPSVLFNACFTAVPSMTGHAGSMPSYDKLARSDVMWKAWIDVATNHGAPGVDGISIVRFEEGGTESVKAFLDNLAGQLRPGPTGPSRYDACTSPSRANRARPARSASPRWATG